MNSIKVNRQALPDLLVAMIENGTWPLPASSAEAISPPIEDTVDLAFLDVTEMVRTTEALRAAIARGDGSLFGLTDEGRLGAGLLDVDAAVVIAATHGQEIVALDYSVGTEPRIVATQYGTAGVTWTEIARSFGALIEKLKAFKG